MVARKLFAVAALAAALCAGCGSSSGGSATATLSNAALTRAAYVSGANPGVKVRMVMHETLPGNEKIAMTADGSFEKPNGTLNMQMTLPASVSALGKLDMTMVIDDGTIYMKMPASLAAELPGGRQWISISYAELGKAEGVPALGSLLASSRQFTNVASELDYIRATGSGVQNLGSQVINGVSTTHYRADMEFSKLAGAVPASERSAMQQLVAELSKRVTVGHIPIDVWLGAGHLVRRETFSEPLTINGQHASVDMQMDFLAYGPQPQPTPPPASQVTDLSSLLSSGA